MLPLARHTRNPLQYIETDLVIKAGRGFKRELKASKVYAQKAASSNASKH